MLQGSNLVPVTSYCPYDYRLTEYRLSGAGVVDRPCWCQTADFRRFGGETFDLPDRPRLAVYDDQAVMMCSVLPAAAIFASCHPGIHVAS